MNALLEEEEITTVEQVRTTAELVQAAQMGDREAFGELFQRYENTVYNVGFRRLGDHGEAQELSQEVFVQALSCFKCGLWLEGDSPEALANVHFGPVDADELTAYLKDIGKADLAAQVLSRTQGDEAP